MTSANSLTWQSKIFIPQYVAEAVLAISNDFVNGSVDQVHASIQIQDAPFHGFSDGFNGTGVLQNPGGVHFPRGITSGLWWLNAANNPPNPVPSVGPSISASLSASRIPVSWPSAYVGWILQTNTVGLGNPAAWCDVPDSLTHSQIIFPAGGPNIPAEFFRLRHPYPRYR